MPTIQEQIIHSHISQNYPDARIVHCNDPDSGLQFYTAEQLQAVDADWFPLCAHLDPQTQKVVYGGRDRIVHTYTEGETGAGKTSRYAMQSIRALSCTKSKPSFLVVDIHGELVENLYDHLKQNGYAVRVLNCDDPSHSDTYNPFITMARRCQESGKIDNQTINELRKIAEIMQPIETDRDPLWDRGACAYTYGLILDKFEDLITGQIEPEYITLYNIIENHYWLRPRLLKTGPSVYNLLKIPHYEQKGSKALSVQKMITVTNTAERTMTSYMSVAEAHFDSFGQPTLYQLSSSSTIDIEEFIEKPTAIFIQSGNTRIGDDLLSLMTNDIYNTAVRIGKKSATKMLPRKIHCFLDEFANSNIAEGPEFIRMLTTSRKFGMYWHMLLQCDAQLERKFDQNMARIIRANCTEIFMGSHDYETTVRFARSCGQRTVESLGSQIARQEPVLTTVDLVTPDKLSLIQEGWMYIKTNRRPLLYTYIEAFYKCPEFVATDDLLSVYPVNDFDYSSTRFTPDDIKPPITEEMFILLRYIYEESPVSIFTLGDVTDKGDAELDAMLKRLTSLRYIHEDTDREVIVSDIANEDYQKLSLLYVKTPRRAILTELAPEEFKIMTHLFNRSRVYVRELTKDFPNCNVLPMLKKLERLALLRFNPMGTMVTCAIDKEQFDRLTSRNSDHINPGDEDTVYKTFEEHIMGLPGYPDLDISKLNRLTCVPSSIRHYISCALGLEEYNPELKLDFLRTLKFEIIEAFISANDFATKEEWDNAMTREMALIMALPYMPLEIVAIFRSATTELTRELTLGNIREIKRIINGN